MGEVREAVFSFLLIFFSCHSFFFVCVCLPVFIGFAVLPFSLARWSLIAAVAVSEVHREISSWWTVEMRHTKKSFEGWRVGNCFANKPVTSSGDT